ncbi:MAG: Abi family protein [Alphaproteobacteria bacterium]
MQLETYTKPPLGLGDQLRLLVCRGLAVQNCRQALHYLKHIGYYRLGGYAHFFQNARDGVTDGSRHTFREGTTFEDVLDYYVFDRKLRLLVLDAIERIENSFRAMLSNLPAANHGAHWYQNETLFRAFCNNKPFDHSKYIEDIKEQIGHEQSLRLRRDVYIRHYYDKYSHPDMPPCWAVFQSVSLGTISVTFQYLIDSESKQIAKVYGLNHKVLSSWLHSLSYVRNVCAHHSVLWNRKFRIRPIAAKKFASELKPNTHIYAQLVVMQVLLHTIAPDNHWAQRLSVLIDEHPNLHLDSMGFPAGWKARHVWRISPSATL